jgi:glycosyltransferase involved in cell wall biosynthesis
MNIAYDEQIFGVQTYGGISRYFCEIATRISRLPETQVTIVAPLPVCAYLQNVPSEIVFGFKLSRMKRFRVARRALGILIGNLMLHASAPDLIHETYFAPYRLGPKKVKRVITIHDMVHEKFASSFPGVDKTAAHKKKTAERADHIICVSESTRRDAIEILGLPPEKITVVHHGFTPVTDWTNAINESTPSGSEPYILYVGQRGAYKNFIRLLEAFASSPLLNTNFKLICLGGGAFNVSEKETISKLGLKSERVRQLEGGDDILTVLYRRASAFVYPSLYEGFGIPPLEAMAHGCPVICSNTSSIPEVVGDAGEYFDPWQVASIRDAIERVVSSELLKSELRRKGSARLSLFSWDRCAIETYDVYKKLI